MSNGENRFLTPVGRIVQGDCFEPQTKDMEGNPLLIRSGPNMGQPCVKYYVGLAIPKTDAGYNELWNEIHNMGRTTHPNLFDAAGTCVNPAFAFKVVDGDSQVPDTKGNKPCDKEGFPGCWVVGFSCGFAPKCYTTGGAELITDANMIKRGYYVRIYGSVAPNPSTSKPGVFVNHHMIELVGYGEEISSGPSGDAVFGATPAAALPAGASATPLAGSAPIAQAAAAPAPMPGQAAAPAPSNVQPAPDFLNVPAAAPAPAVAEVKYLDANGGAFTEAQLLAVGYQPAQIQALTRA